MKKFLLLLSFLLLPIQALFASDSEVEKLQWHLGRVEGILRQVDTSTLTQEQKENRTKMLDRLHSYTLTGKFPNNDKFPGESIPFFRGSNGNLCAVGYLMDADPEYKGFIDTIVKTNNNIRIMDVQDNPILNTWAKKYGFSILELAMIQPTYSCEMMGRKVFFGECYGSYGFTNMVQKFMLGIYGLLVFILIILGFFIKKYWQFSIKKYIFSSVGVLILCFLFFLVVFEELHIAYIVDYFWK